MIASACRPDADVRPEQDATASKKERGTELRHQVEMEKLRANAEQHERLEAQYRQAMSEWNRMQVGIKQALQDPNSIIGRRVRRCRRLEDNWRYDVERADETPAMTLEGAALRNKIREEATQSLTKVNECWANALEKPFGDNPSPETLPK